MRLLFFYLLLSGLLLPACQNTTESETTAETETDTTEAEAMPTGISEPLVTDIYTADPSAHVFEGKIYIYPSHDIESGVPQDDMGSHFDMQDYHVFSMEEPMGEVTDHGVALAVEDIPWAKRQLWAPDAASKDGVYYFYFPAKDADDVFRLGVATSTQPMGPFEPQPAPPVPVSTAFLPNDPL